MLTPSGGERLHIALRGAVQGIGFRPTVYRIAQALRLSGWVCENEAGIEMEVEGTPERLSAFLARLKTDRPHAAVVAQEEVVHIAPQHSTWFEILRTARLNAVSTD